MKPQQTALLVFTFSLFIGSDLAGSWAHGEPLSESNLGSTLKPQCDLCWNPSSSESAPDRLPTHKYHRPHRPPDSRPHRIPKGGYKLVPDKKQTRSALLRARARRYESHLRMQQIVVIDGDTIRIGGERIRLRGIDTPEMNEWNGQEAKERLEELLKSGPTEIIPHGRDVYDRLVADVLVNGQDVAEILKSEGFAKTH